MVNGVDVDLGEAAASYLSRRGGESPSLNSAEHLS